MHSYTALAWTFKGTTWGLTRILFGQQDIVLAISWECGLLMALMPNQLKDTICFDWLY